MDRVPAPTVAPSQVERQLQRALEVTTQAAVVSPLALVIDGADQGPRGMFCWVGVLRQKPKEGGARFS